MWYRKIRICCVLILYLKCRDKRIAVLFEVYTASRKSKNKKPNSWICCSKNNALLVGFALLSRIFADKYIWLIFWLKPRLMLVTFAVVGYLKPLTLSDATELFGVVSSIPEGRLFLLQDREVFFYLFKMTFQKIV